ncbi:AzlD domain-containing protein [Morganella morganii]|uniref:AzlD domain-containing protein n=1 Tax=Morganella morganii TaxID=582 RepID=UPI001BD6334C|nr:AzlD domain-containing protein [Morganella morganii]MBT0420130.1 AzlD domain-containing protein [Morganella morganii subsp. morganii]MBT0514364.1 AzlD domain-containing protein [Morganella morganii subsp. morganii]MCU6353541.1 AzlD domain-containing protein [Morganella morganii]QWM02511.1 AzlD domain-containing protein [Morganella morganii subsp. morganii]HBL6964702.1 AzlD domain-containing protein [Morganella morganii]
MSWGLIFALTLMLFSLRFIFLIPGLPLRLPVFIQQALTYSAPCLLVAICAPVVLLEEQQFRDISDNPYLWGTLFCIIAARLIKNTLLTVVLTLVFFYTLIYLF